MLSGKKLDEEEIAPEGLQNLTVTQQKNYGRFREPLSAFHLYGRNRQTPREDIMYIGIHDGYLDTIDVGKIMPDGSISLIFPDVKNLSESGFKEILGETLRLKKTLDELKIPYSANRDMDEYKQEVKEHLVSKVEGLVSRI